MTAFVPLLHTVPESSGNLVYVFANWFIHLLHQHNDRGSLVVLVDVVKKANGAALCVTFH